MRIDSQTLYERMSPRKIKNREDFGYALSNFLDQFYRNTDGLVFMEEPLALQQELGDEGVADAFLASTVAYLCQKYELAAPDWVNKPERILRKPWFAAKTPGLRAILLQESPAAFRVRNLFVSANALSRA